MSIAKEVIKKHLIKGELKQGNEIAIKVDQTLTQDATGTMAYLQFEALNLPEIKTQLSVSYVDHNITETGKQNIEFH
jgi:aconitate hydratase